MAFQFNKIDTNKTESGVWFEDDSDATENPASFLIAAFGNPAHMKAIKKLTVTRRGKKQSLEDLDPEQSIEFLVKTMAQTILLDWKGLTDAENGIEIPYSLENAKLMLENDVDFRNWVSDKASETQNFYTERLGKSEKPPPQKPKDMPAAQTAA